MMTWNDEAGFITECAHDHGVDPAFIAAIRKAEAGGDGRQFGVLAVVAPDYWAQLRVCVATIRTYLSEYGPNPFATMTTPRGIRRLCYAEAFVQYAARRYAPVGAGNDPKNLNTAWCENVEQLYMGFLNHGLVSPKATAHPNAA